jgi:hypothetical protein
MARAGPSIVAIRNGRPVSGSGSDVGLAELRTSEGAAPSLAAAMNSPK